jgi:hypothetical protein
MADDQSMATVAVNGAKALAVQEAQYSLAASKAARDRSMSAAVPPAGEQVRQAAVLLALALGNEMPSSETGRMAKDKLLDALRKEYRAVGVLDDLIVSGAEDTKAKRRLATALKQVKAARREALTAGKLLRQILN